MEQDGHIVGQLCPRTNSHNRRKGKHHFVYGCAHNGIVNILNIFIIRSAHAGLAIGGFHLQILQRELMRTLRYR